MCVSLCMCLCVTFTVSLFIWLPVPVPPPAAKKAVGREAPMFTGRGRLEQTAQGLVNLDHPKKGRLGNPTDQPEK